VEQLKKTLSNEMIMKMKKRVCRLPRGWAAGSLSTHEATMGVLQLYKPIIWTLSYMLGRVMNRSLMSMGKRGEGLDFSSKTLERPRRPEGCIGSTTPLYVLAGTPL
jgi:hypothetical protein